MRGCLYDDSPGQYVLSHLPQLPVPVLDLHWLAFGSAMRHQHAVPGGSLSGRLLLSKHQLTGAKLVFARVQQQLKLPSCELNVDTLHAIPHPA